MVRLPSSPNIFLNERFANALKDEFLSRGVAHAEQRWPTIATYYVVVLVGEYNSIPDASDTKFRCDYHRIEEELFLPRATPLHWDEQPWLSVLCNLGPGLTYQACLGVISGGICLNCGPIFYAYRDSCLEYLNVLSGNGTFILPRPIT
jgi:hypothetical protein